MIKDKGKGTVPRGTVPSFLGNYPLKFKKFKKRDSPNRDSPFITLLNKGQSLIKYQKKEKFWSSPYFYAFINLSELNIHSSDTPTSAKIARNIVATPNAPKIKIIIFKIKASPIFS